MTGKIKLRAEINKIEAKQCKESMKQRVVSGGYQQNRQTFIQVNQKAEK